MSDLEIRVAALEKALPKMVPVAALEIYAKDPHMFSSRPCATCQNISAVIGRPWGCSAYGRKTEHPT